MRFGTGMRWITMMGLLALVAGCASSRGNRSEPMAIFRPDLRRFDPGFMAAGSADPAGTPMTVAAVPAVTSTTQPAVETPRPPMIPTPTAMATPPLLARLLEPGDDVLISVHVREKIDVEDRLDEFGRVTLPYLGSIRIAGMTTSGAEKTIRDAYVREKIFKQDGVEITVMANAPPFFVTGAVNRPGTYPLRDGGLTFSQAIIMAGGPSLHANRKRIKLVRRGVPRELNLEKILENEAADPYIEPGDIITVDEKVW